MSNFTPHLMLSDKILAGTRPGQSAMHGMLPQCTRSQDAVIHTGALWGHARRQKSSLGVVGEGVCGDLPVVLLHAGHDVVLVVHAVVPLLVLAPLLQRKGHQRQPLAAADQLEVACMTRCTFTTYLAPMSPCASRQCNAGALQLASPHPQHCAGPEQAHLQQ